MIRKDSPQLKAELNAFLDRIREGAAGATAPRAIPEEHQMRQGGDVAGGAQKFERTVELFRSTATGTTSTTCC